MCLAAKACRALVNLVAVLNSGLLFPPDSLLVLLLNTAEKTNYHLKGILWGVSAVVQNFRSVQWGHTYLQPCLGEIGLYYQQAFNACFFCKHSEFLGKLSYHTKHILDPGSHCHVWMIMTSRELSPGVFCFIWANLNLHSHAVRSRGPSYIYYT